MTLQQVTFTKHSNRLTARCGRCNRPLTDPESKRLGIGPECRKHEHGFVVTGLCRRIRFLDQFDNAIPFRTALVMRRGLRDVMQDGEERPGGVVTNVPHLIVNRSSSGYEFGFSGDGPSDLALNICQLYLNMTGYEGKKLRCEDGECWSLAYALHRDFREYFIASAPRTGKMVPFAEMDAWFKTHITGELIVQFATQIIDLEE